MLYILRRTYEFQFVHSIALQKQSMVSGEPNALSPLPFPNYREIVQKEKYPVMQWFTSTNVSDHSEKNHSGRLFSDIMQHRYRQAGMILLPVALCVQLKLFVYSSTKRGIYTFSVSGVVEVTCIILFQDLLFYLLSLQKAQFISGLFLTLLTRKKEWICAQFHFILLAKVFHHE